LTGWPSLAGRTFLHLSWERSEVTISRWIAGTAIALAAIPVTAAPTGQISAQRLSVETWPSPQPAFPMAV
jgi:hypothetical protein